MSRIILTLIFFILPKILLATDHIEEHNVKNLLKQELAYQFTEQALKGKLFTHYGYIYNSVLSDQLKSDIEDLLHKNMEDVSDPKNCIQKFLSELDIFLLNLSDKEIELLYFYLVSYRHSNNMQQIRNKYVYIGDDNDSKTFDSLDLFKEKLESYENYKKYVSELIPSLEKKIQDETKMFLEKVRFCTSPEFDNIIQSILDKDLKIAVRKTEELNKLKNGIIRTAHETIGRSLRDQKVSIFIYEGYEYFSLSVKGRKFAEIAASVGKDNTRSLSNGIILLGDLSGVSDSSFDILSSEQKVKNANQNLHKSIAIVSFASFVGGAIIHSIVNFPKVINNPKEQASMMGIVFTLGLAIQKTYQYYDYWRISSYLSQDKKFILARKLPNTSV